MNLSTEHKALFSLLRAGLWEREADDLSPFPLTDAQWWEVYRMSVRQTVAEQEEGRAESGANLVVVTHKAPDAALSATVAALGELDTVREVVSVMRVEGE